MPKQIISFSLSDEAVTKIDDCSEGHKNRSDFIEWLAENNFFLNKDTLSKLCLIATTKTELKETTQPTVNKEGKKE